MLMHQNVRADELASDPEYYGTTDEVHCRHCGRAPHYDVVADQSGVRWHVVSATEAVHADICICRFWLADDRAERECDDNSRDGCFPPATHVSAPTDPPLTEDEGARRWGNLPYDSTSQEQRRRKRRNRAEIAETMDRLLGRPAPAQRRLF